jgi:hypothetical protein
MSSNRAEFADGSDDGGGRTRAEQNSTKFPAELRDSRIALGNLK